MSLSPEAIRRIKILAVVAAIILATVVILNSLAIIVLFHCPPTINLLFNVSSNPTAVAASSHEARAYNAIWATVRLVALAAFILAIAAVAKKGSPSLKFFKDNKIGLATLFAIIMDLGLLNYLFWDLFSWWVQLLFIGGVFLAGVLLETEKKTGQRILALSLIAFLVMLLGSDLQRQNGYLARWHPFPSRACAAATVASAEAAATSPKWKEIRVMAPVGRWSDLVSIPLPTTIWEKRCGFTTDCKGQIRVQTIAGKEWEDGPGKVIHEGDLATLKDFTRRFMSLEDHEVEVIIRYEEP